MFYLCAFCALTKSIRVSFINQSYQLSFLSRNVGLQKDTPLRMLFAEFCTISCALYLTTEYSMPYSCKLIHILNFYAKCG